MQGKCQRVACAIHAFSIVWRLPKTSTPLQGGKLVRVGIPCVYKRIGGWEQTRHLCPPLFPGHSLATAKERTCHSFVPGTEKQQTSQPLRRSRDGRKLLTRRHFRPQRHRICLF